MTDEYQCPVCGEHFESYGAADHHYDMHKPSEYILEIWVKQTDE